jgi:hypothetical protein
LELEGAWREGGGEFFERAVKGDFEEVCVAFAGDGADDGGVGGEEEARGVGGDLVGVVDGVVFVEEDGVLDVVALDGEAEGILRGVVFGRGLDAEDDEGFLCVLFLEVGEVGEDVLAVDAVEVEEV